MAYEIKQRNEADYRYYRFQGESELLERLDHNLKIADGALRFRVFKVDPDTPEHRAAGLRPPRLRRRRPPRSASDRGRPPPRRDRDADRRSLRASPAPRGEKDSRGRLVDSQFGNQEKRSELIGGFEHQRRSRSRAT